MTELYAVLAGVGALLPVAQLGGIGDDGPEPTVGAEDRTTAAG